jgi:hypothetical protein
MQYKTSSQDSDSDTATKLKIKIKTKSRQETQTIYILENKTRQDNITQDNGSNLTSGERLDKARQYKPR